MFEGASELINNICTLNDENNVTESYEKVNPADIDSKMDTWFIFFGYLILESLNVVTKKAFIFKFFVNKTNYYHI